MSKIIRIDITDDQRRRAKELYDFNALNHSFTNGRGNMTGALGEIMVFDYYNPQLKFDNTFDYDLVTVNNNWRIDVKSKKITFDYPPSKNFKVGVSTAGKGIKQNCDLYCFTFVHESYQYGYILGWYNKEKFVNDVLDKKGIDDKLNFDDEIERLDLYSWRNLYEKTYTMVDANGRTVPDYAQIYVALTSPEQIQKLDLDIPLGKMEILITTKLKKNLGYLS